MGRLRFAVAVAVGLATAVAGVRALQPGDGRVRVALTLDAQAIEVSYSPALSAADSAHAALLSGSIGASAPVGALTADSTLRIGSIAYDVDAPRAPAPPGAPPPRVSYDLWLARTADGWELEARGGGDTGVVPLTHRTVADPAPTLGFSLHAIGAETGRLYLRWGPHVWSAEFRFDDLPPQPQQLPGSGGFGEALQRDSDTSATARANRLAERNETALALPDGARIVVLYGKHLPVDGVDYPNLPATPDGAVVELLRAPALRIRSDVALRFGQTDLPTANLAPGFAGLYALWLKRAGDGWRIVFNDEPDSWGTQHDPAFDAAEVAVEYARADGGFRPLGVTLVPTGADGGRLVVHWGPHEWAADFVIVR
ncbi:MAG: DUF2911 domain-containing protein [Acidobacteria bacterium]|nr:DUF2911 domain-containing protein [Acidobacteriota bacterium]